MTSKGVVNLEVPVGGGLITGRPQVGSPSPEENLTNNVSIFGY